MRHHKEFTGLDVLVLPKICAPLPLPFFTVTLEQHVCTRPNLHSQLSGDGCEFFIFNEKQGGSSITPHIFDVTLFTDANG